MKPLATLGEVMNDIDWRAQRRLAGVPSRPPPSDRAGRPDRGYVEQPEERVEPVVLRKRGLIPMAELERVQLEELAAELGEPSPFEDTPRPPPERETRVFPPPPERQLTLQPQPETQPSEAPAPEATEMAAKKRKGPWPMDVKQRAVARVQELRAGKEGRNTGAISQTARELGTSEANISSWVFRYPINGSPAAEKTLVSSPQSGPVSAPMSAVGELPPLPTVNLTGLEEYVKAIVKQAVAAEFRRRLQGMAD